MVHIFIHQWSKIDIIISLISIIRLIHIVLSIYINTQVSVDLGITDSVWQDSAQPLLLLSMD